MYNYPILLAEVASTVNEQLLFDYQYQQAQNDQEKIFLLQKRIEDIIATFYRQVMIADFEYETHQRAVQKKPLGAEDLAGLFETLSHTYNGDVLTKSTNTQLRYR